MSAPGGPEQPGETRSFEYSVRGTLDVDIAAAAGQVRIVLGETAGTGAPAEAAANPHTAANPESAGPATTTSATETSPRPTEPGDVGPGDVGPESLVRVELAAEPAPAWAQSVTDMVSWVQERFGGQLGAQVHPPVGDALGQTEVEMQAGRLVVRTPTPVPGQAAAVSVTVHAPGGTRVAVETGSARVEVSGRCGGAEIATGSGEVSVAESAGPLRVRTGAGTVRVGSCAAEVDLHTGSGAVRMDTVTAPGGSHLSEPRTGEEAPAEGTEGEEASGRGITGDGPAGEPITGDGPAGEPITGDGTAGEPITDDGADGDGGTGSVVTGSGDVWLGELAGNMRLRSSSGGLTVADARAGALELLASSGDVRVGVHPGQHAEVDLHSESNTVTSELPLAETAPVANVALRIRARTRSGTATVRRAGR